MTGWDLLDRLTSSFPPITMMLILAAVLVAVVIFIVGFSRHGISFLKYGFKQMALDSSIERRFDSMEAKFSEIKTELATIKTNHFGHLKGFLTELTSILLDKEIINNTDKTRLDNQLRDM